MERDEEINARTAGRNSHGGFLPKVVGNKYDNINQALANQLDKEGLLRLEAVEKTVAFFSTRSGAHVKTEQENFQKTFEDIYNFLIKTNE